MPKKILTGVVISDKPNKTVTVMVERKYSHPVLKKSLESEKITMLMMKIIHLKQVIKFRLLKANLFQKIKNFKLWRIINNDWCTDGITSC